MSTARYRSASWWSLLSSGPAKIRTKTTHVIAKDYMSSNGTFINGVKIEKQLLIHADLIQLGAAANLLFINSACEEYK